MKALARVMLLAAVLSGASPASASELGASAWVQRTFRATGRWDGEVLQAESIQLRESYDEVERLQVSGRVTAQDARRRRFRLGPVRVEWAESTRLERLEPAQIVDGRAVRVSGRINRQGTLVASSIRPADNGRADALQVTAIVTEAAERADGSFDFTMAGVPVRTRSAGYNGVESLIRRQDARRPSALVDSQIAGRPFVVMGEYAMQVRDRRNYELERVRDEVLDSETEFQLEAYYAPWQTVHVFAGAKLIYDAELVRGGGTREPNLAVERDQAWVFFDRILGSSFGLQVGRQNFKETREWWWDDDLDAVRLYFDRAGLHAELGLARELTRVSSLQDDIDPRQQDVVRTLGMASWLWAPRQKLEAYFLHADDRSGSAPVGTRLDESLEDSSDARLTWYGLRAIGSRDFGRRGAVEYWADWAAVTGNETRVRYGTAGTVSTVTRIGTRDVRGSAIDLGLTWESPLPLSPSLTLGYARGSGDADDSDGVDRSFRQTGLHNNNWRYSGVNRFRVYGEVLRPELSNLAILTASVGMPLLRSSSVELSWHRYRQLSATDSLRDVRLDADPSGLSPDIGEEIDLVLGFREGRRLDVEVAAGMFLAGEAYVGSGRRRAYFGQVEITWNF
jgi:alginate production protein